MTWLDCVCVHSSAAFVSHQPEPLGSFQVEHTQRPSKFLPDQLASKRPLELLLYFRPAGFTAGNVGPASQ